jgi:hypothetical protein
MLSEGGVISKATVTRLFIGAILAVVAGVATGVVSVVAAIVGGAVSIGGPNVVTVDGGAFAATLGWLAIASVIGAAGALAALASWIGALLNTVRLEDKTWFVVLLVLGVFSFGWVAVAAYVMAGPDGTTRGAALTGRASLRAADGSRAT